MSYQPYSTGDPRPPTQLVWAILATVLCCLPFGIVYAAQVNTKWDAGDPQGAHEYSDKALTWAIVAAACGLIAMVIWAFVAGSEKPEPDPSPRF